MASNSEMGITFSSGYDPAMLGARLKMAREHAGLSQRQAAQTLGNVTHGAISQWESTGRIATDNLLAAARLYRCDPMWLLTGTGRAPGEPVVERDVVDRAIMTDAIAAVLTVLQGLRRCPPPAVTARIINLIYNRHVDGTPSRPLDADRVQDIVAGVVEYLGDAGDDVPGHPVVHKQGRDDQD